MYVCTEAMNAATAFSVGGVDVASVTDIFHLHEGIISSEAPVEPPKAGDSFTGTSRQCFF